MPYIGLDVGTSGCKASVVDAAGNILASGHVEYAPASPRPGYIEVDPGQVWAAVRQALRAVARPDITAMAIASFGEAAILMDENDDVLANSIYYSDIRGGEEVADFLTAFDARRAQAITGTKANPMYTACKLLWIKKHQPELYAKTRHIMLFGDFIGYMLTGERVIDYSLASRTMLFDIKAGAFSAELGGALGIDVGMFSRPVRAGTPVGRLRPAMAQSLGLPENLLLVAGGHDQVLAALGGGCTSRGHCVDGMGSSESVNLLLRGEEWTQAMAEYNFCCEPYVFENTYMTIAFNASSGTATRWYRDCFEHRRAAEAGAGGQSIYAVMDAECPAAPTGLLFLPHVAGSGTPWLDSSMGGAVLGLRVGTTSAEVYKSILEGISYEIAYNFELMAKCGLEPAELSCVGGGSKSDVLMQIKADVMNRELAVLRAGETGTLGLALLCAAAVGDIADLAAEARRLRSVRKVFTPSPERAAQYRRLMEQYRRVYPAMREVFG